MNGKQQGFTIAEVVISMVMLSIILVTLGGLTYVSAQRAIIATASSHRQAYSLETVNRLTTLPYANLAGAAGCDTTGSTNNEYERCVTVTPSGNSARVQVVTTPLHFNAPASTVNFVRIGASPTNPLCSGC
ncbi:MAG TPA: prepilin-type N-terminal cleavage/methylation domain-containing protein [Longimicrobiales bacterium]|nr:prepilin-type N-terminal cleavage/methylation domain-containing protein [Longimicrobiales bacterium]